MPVNVPVYTEGNFSFGPGRLFLGAVGTTPTVDIGAITEDGIQMMPENATKDIKQGNPKMVAYTFNQEHGFKVNVTGIEWNFTNLAYALGAGNTTSTGAQDTWAFGGEPITNRCAIHVQHQMAVLGHTLNAYVWTAVKDGDPTLPLIHDEHNFALAFKAQRTITDWAGNTLADSEQLMKIARIK